MRLKGAIIGAVTLAAAAGGAFKLQDARAVENLDDTLSVTVISNNGYYKDAEYFDVSDGDIPKFTVKVLSTDAENTGNVCVAVGSSDYYINHAELVCGDIDETDAESGHKAAVLEVPVWSAQNGPVETAGGKVRAYVAADEQDRTVIAKSEEYTVVDAIGLDGVATTGVILGTIGKNSASFNINYTIPIALRTKVSKVAATVSLDRVFDYYYSTTDDVSGGGMGGGNLLQNCNGSGGSAAINSYSYKGETVTVHETYQSFSRCTDLSGEQSDYTPSESGQVSISVDGLLADTKYGNWSGYNDEMNGVWQHDAYSSLLAGIVLRMDDGSFYTEYVSSADAAHKIPDFTTLPLDAKTEEELTEDNRGKISGANDNAAVSSAAYKIYLDNPSQACKTGADSKNYCYYSAYIYSDPTQLYDANGSKLLAVKKDEDGKYRIEVVLPGEYEGQHKIALYDENESFAGWAEVKVTKGDEVKVPDTGVLSKTIDFVRSAGVYLVPITTGFTVAAVLTFIFVRSKKSRL